jgi:hypothetical protein
MTVADKPDLAAGWGFVEDLLAADELERLEKLTDAELEAELKADGLDAGRLPAVTELVAAGAERAREPDAARGWRHVEKLLQEGELDSSRLPGAGELVARASAQSRVAKVVPIASRRRARLVAALVAVAASPLVVLAVGNRAALVAAVRREPIRPGDTWLPWRAAPTPHERAEALRSEAIASCDAGQWQVCGRRLDEALAMDPDGEAQPGVQAMRRAIVNGQTRDAATKPDEPRRPGERGGGPVP